MTRWLELEMDRFRGILVNAPMGWMRSHMTMPVVVHVDDSVDDRLLFSRAFRSSGIPGELISIPTTKEAVLYLQKRGAHTQSPDADLFVLDFSMPWINGDHLIHYLREARMRPAPPVVILSDRVEPGMLDLCRQLGLHHIRKPDTLENLVRVVRELMASLRSQALGSHGAR